MKHASRKKKTATPKKEHFEHVIEGGRDTIQQRRKVQLHHWREWKKGAVAPLTENENGLGEIGKVGSTLLGRRSARV